MNILILSFCLLSTGECQSFPSAQAVGTIEACERAGEKSVAALEPLAAKRGLFRLAGFTCREERED